MSLPPNKAPTSAMPGLAAIGLIVTGIAAIGHAFLTGSPLSLFAAAVSFGLIFIISFI